MAQRCFGASIDAFHRLITESFRRKFRGVFREQLDPEGRPVPFTVFRDYMQAPAVRRLRWLRNKKKRPC